MDNTTMKEQIESRLGAYNLLSYFFLALPDKDFVSQIMNLDFNTFENGKIDEDVFTGIELIQDFIQNSESKPLDDVLLEVSIDRTQLLRGLSHDGPRPPYESGYLDTPAEIIHGQLAAIYGKADYGFYNEINESPEHIGVELAFMTNLCEMQLETNVNDDKHLSYLLDLQSEFLVNHLGQWANIYAHEMLSFARTDFYRGIALVLKGFIQGELKQARELVPTP